MGFPGGSVLKNPPAKQEILGLGRILGLAEEMATHSSIIAWEILWTEKPTMLQFMGSQTVRHDLVTKLSCMVALQLISFQKLSSIFSKRLYKYYYISAIKYEALTIPRIHVIISVLGQLPGDLPSSLGKQVSCFGYG